MNDGVLEPTPHGNPATTLSENVWSPCAVLTLEVSNQGSTPVLVSGM